jgi:hypothetical protein
LETVNDNLDEETINKYLNEANLDLNYAINNYMEDKKRLELEKAEESWEN